MKPDTAFNPRNATKKLLRESRSGALATLMPGSGDPYCSLVNVASSADGAPLLLISGLAVHTKNILADARVSLMLDERKPGDPLEGVRIMLMGRAGVTQSEHDRRRYLVRQPEAEMFAGFSDFALYRVALSGVHLVAGFGRIVDLKPGDVLTDISDAAALLDAEADAVDHMNEEHRDTLSLYATRLLGMPDASWRCVGCDPEGLDLQHERIALRLPFPRRVTSPDMLRQVLKELADAARSR